VRRHLATVSGEGTRVLVGDDADAVHDLRVATRRLQEALSVLGVLDGDAPVDRWRRSLRRVRRALGTWRNLDVVLEDVKGRRRRTRSPLRRGAWAAFRAELERMRVDEIHRARKRIRREDLASLCEDASLWLSDMEGKADLPPVRPALGQRLARIWQRWQDAVVHATRTASVANVHAMRIATKRLRYHCEIAAAVSEASAKDVQSWTRDLQEALGDWHDQQVLHELVARVLGRPDFLLAHLEIGEALLAEVARERKTSPDPGSQLPNATAVDAGRALVETLIGRLTTR
jgi:CHAD domain-containing protein